MIAIDRMAVRHRTGRIHIRADRPGRACADGRLSPMKRPRAAALSNRTARTVRTIGFR